MRRYIKKQLLNLFKTLYQAQETVAKLISAKRFEQAYDILVQLQENAIKIGETIEAEAGEGTEAVGTLEQTCELIYEVSEKMGQEDVSKLCKKIKEKFTIIEHNIKYDIPDSKLEVVFLPYKISMWDSLASIWKAASEDEECNCSIIPIPYYSKDGAGNFEQMHYEGNEFPADVPVVDYRTVNLEKMHPDIIFIHNPYDQYNHVTSVDMSYYSAVIRNYTEMLVYVPYFVAGVYKNLESAAVMCRVPGVIYSDKVVVQSDVHKEIFIKNGIDASKLMVMGSPKLDASICCINEEKSREEHEGKTTFLLNTSISHLLKDEKWFDFMDKLLKIFSKDTSLILIWRPHPLLKDTICSMRKNMLERYEALTREIEKMDNVIIDNAADVYHSFRVSDALISDYSSLMMQYVATGKPVLNISGQAWKRDKMIVVFDYFSNYFVNDGMTYEDFIQMVKDKVDVKQAERLMAMKKSTKNCDGSCGAKVYAECKRVFGE